MIKRNKVKHLNRTSSHRKAMIQNMVTSLFKHERIQSTTAKIKVARSFAEKLISRAKKNLDENVTPEVALHNRREVLRKIKDKTIVQKLFEDIAPRYAARPGGYTRILKLVNRVSDNSEVGILELVDRKTGDEIKAKLKENFKAKKSEDRKQKEETRKKRIARPKKETSAKSK
ncbi:MAG: 50S ribosomal protein L17 [Leptospiraceae bacterium]|nr:50S ribosomal protein L17 [Leptospiraceae bacterium]MCP5496667.1 50S ribosomal protein L17 [Leptospiraceae bacterium]